MQHRTGRSGAVRCRIVRFRVVNLRNTNKAPCISAIFPDDLQDKTATDRKSSYARIPPGYLPEVSASGRQGSGQYQMRRDRQVMTFRNRPQTIRNKPVIQGTSDRTMTRQLMASDRPVLRCESSQWQASSAIYVLNRTIFHHNLLAPDLKRFSRRK